MVMTFKSPTRLHLQKTHFDGMFPSKPKKFTARTKFVLFRSRDIQMGFTVPLKMGHPVYIYIYIYTHRMRHKNPDKFQFKFSSILCLRQTSLLAMSKPDASSKQS